MDKENSDSGSDGGKSTTSDVSQNTDNVFGGALKRGKIPTKNNTSVNVPEKTEKFKANRIFNNAIRKENILITPLDKKNEENFETYNSKDINNINFI